MNKIIILSAVLIISTVIMCGCSTERDELVITETMPAPENNPEVILDDPAGNSNAGEIEVPGNMTEDPAEDPSADPSGDDGDEPSGDESPAEELPPEGTEFMKKSVNSFNWKLYKLCSGDGNLFFSPYGIVSALSLTDLAAAGDTKKEMEESLSIEDMEAFKKEMRYFLSREQGDTAYMKTANGLFIDKSLSLSPSYEKEFKEPAEEFFKGEFRSMDFKNDPAGANKEISAWVKDSTDDMIPDYQAGADSNTVADILNAVYFYGEWQEKFRSKDTSEGTFRGMKGDKETDMMRMRDESFRYVSEIKGVKAVALPYKGSSYEMDIMIAADPDEKDISALLKVDGPEDILEALDNADNTELRMLSIPRFKLDTKLAGLKDMLISMGMSSAFSDSADFSLLAEDIKISDVCHQAVAEVDEEGSRAAAVTEVIMELTSAAPDNGPEEEFIADKPFIFFIRDRESGVILFTGRMNDPE